MLHDGKTSAVEVLRAFQWNALKALNHTNCVTEFFMEAEPLAEELDSKYGRSSEKPPFFGIPISVKDCLEVNGTTLCYHLSELLGCRVDMVVKTLFEGRKEGNQVMHVYQKKL